MRNIIFAYIGVILIIVVIALFRNNIIGTIKPGFSFFKLGNSSSPQVKIGSQTFAVEIADDLIKQQIGLSKKNSLEQNKGMLFIFNEKGRHAFWMRDMKFAIDIIFIDDTKIVDIKKNFAPPKSTDTVSNLPIYEPKANANYILEINAGLSDKYKIKGGDTVEFKNIKLLQK